MSKHKKQHTKKKVSIIIPFYGQNESDLAIPLSSINNQVNVDFAKIDVHLVNDGGKSIDIEKFAIFANLDIYYHELSENVGPGMARQYGIDHSNGEYVMFLDSDDELYYPVSLSQFFEQFVGAKSYDILQSNIVGQAPLGQFGNRYSYFTYTADSEFSSVSVCGKWFSREYLKSQDLKFVPELRVNEDAYFVYLAQCFTANVINIFSPTYLARYNPNSIMRNEKEQSLRQVEQYVLAQRLRLRKFKEKLPEKDFQDKLEYAIAAVYHNQVKYDPIDKEAFWKEVRFLASEFPYDYEKQFERLSFKAELMTQKRNEEYDRENFKRFLKKI